MPSAPTTRIRRIGDFRVIFVVFLNSWPRCKIKASITSHTYTTGIAQLMSSVVANMRPRLGPPVLLCPHPFPRSSNKQIQIYFFLFYLVLFYFASNSPTWLTLTLALQTVPADTSSPPRLLPIPYMFELSRLDSSLCVPPVVSPNATSLCIHLYIHAVCCASGRAVLLCCVSCDIKSCVCGGGGRGVSSAVRPLFRCRRSCFIICRITPGIVATPTHVASRHNTTDGNNTPKYTP